MENEKILSDAERAIVLYKASRPGGGDMKSRKASREEAAKLIMPFLKKSQWPGSQQGRARKIDDALIDVYERDHRRKLKSERQRRGLTQAKAAVVCGVSPRAYWQWEAGKSALDVTLEGALARLQSTAPGPKAKGQNDKGDSSAVAD